MSVVNLQVQSSCGPRIESCARCYRNNQLDCGSYKRVPDRTPPVTLNLFLFRLGNVSDPPQGDEILEPSEWAGVLAVAVMRNSALEPLTRESRVSFSLSTLD